MATVISFASQKGGVGKTTSAVHLATAFALGGYRTLLLDLDPQGSVYSAMGVKQRVIHGILEIFCQDSTTLSDVLLPTSTENMHLILNDVDRLTHENELMKVAADYHHLHQWLARHARGEFEFIIIDVPASTNALSINAMVASNLVIVPMQCEALAIKSLKRFLLAFKDLQANIDPNLRIAGILLTMFDHEIPAHQKVCRQVYQTLGESVFQTIIPKCPQVLDASAAGMDVINRSLNSIGATGYIRLANEILDRFRLR